MTIKGLINHLGIHKKNVNVAPVIMRIFMIQAQFQSFAASHVQSSHFKADGTI